MNALILCAVLCGPLPEAQPSLRLIIHVGQGRESDVVRQELRRPDPWFAGRRAMIEQHYRIEVKETLYRSRPQYQIGKGDEKHDFPPGTFSCAGSFTRTIESLTDSDQYDRWEPDQPFYGLYFGEWTPPKPRPKVFPPVIESREQNP